MPTLPYERRRPEQTPLYQVVAENLETLYGAIDDGAVHFRLAKHACKELEAYLDCGILCRGFARLWCADCKESRLVAFSCKGRGFCPSCPGRRMCGAAANLAHYILPEQSLRQWVLTFPFAWRARLAHDGALLSALTACCRKTVLGFYDKATRKQKGSQGQSGAIVVLQRTSSDLRPKCKGRLKLIAMVTETARIVRFLSAIGEPTTPPPRSPPRGPPYGQSTALQRTVVGEVA